MSFKELLLFLQLDMALVGAFEFQISKFVVAVIYSTFLKFERDLCEP